MTYRIKNMRKKLRKVLLLIKYVWVELKRPAGTVFELDYTNENRRQVSKLEYIIHNVKWLWKI